MATVRLNDRAVLTTDHAAVSYAWPAVLLRDGQVFGPADTMPEDAIHDYPNCHDLGWPLTAATYAMTGILAGSERTQSDCNLIHAFAR